MELLSYCDGADFRGALKCLKICLSHRLIVPNRAPGDHRAVKFDEVATSSVSNEMEIPRNSLVFELFVLELEAKLAWTHSGSYFGDEDSAGK